MSDGSRANDGTPKTPARRPEFSVLG